MRVLRLDAHADCLVFSAAHMATAATLFGGAVWGL
jgi:hypothetical protein